MEERNRREMPQAFGRKGLVILALIGAMVLVGVTAACGNEEEADETTSTTVTETSAATNSSTVTSVETIVVGGSTTEEYEAALPDLEAAVVADQQDLEALQELAIAQFQTGRYEEAAATYEKMLAIEDDAFTRNNYANVLRNWGKTDEAKAQYEQAIETDPTLAFAYVNLAVLLSQQGDNQGALEVLQSGVDKVPDEDKASLEGLIERLTATSTTT